MGNIVSKFLHTRMRVSNLEETVKFYQTVFGLEVSRRHESPRGSKLVFLDSAVSYFYNQRPSLSFAFFT